MTTRKQVSWNDFIAGAEWLVRERYTSARHLGIFGGSGGGLLVGVAATQRPDLFAAVAPLQGVLDMMRFHLFGEGAGWAGDWGSPTVPDEAPALRAYSPVHNVRAGTRYPPSHRHQRSRRARRAAAFVQARGRAPGRAGGAFAAPPPGRDHRGPRRRDHEIFAHRQRCRAPGVLHALSRVAGLT